MKSVYLTRAQAELVEKLIRDRLNHPVASGTAYELNGALKKIIVARGGERP